MLKVRLLGSGLHRYRILFYYIRGEQHTSSVAALGLMHDENNDEKYCNFSVINGDIIRLKRKCFKSNKKYLASFSTTIPICLRPTIKHKNLVVTSGEYKHFYQKLCFMLALNQHDIYLFLCKLKNIKNHLVKHSENN
jgi:hypothetical protein